MSQKTIILQHLKKGKRITTLQAAFDFGCLRLSERIREIEAEGVAIARAWVQQNGKRYMAYWLA